MERATAREWRHPGLSSARKRVPIRQKKQKTLRYGLAKERVKRKHYGGGQEDKECKHNPLQYRQGPGHRLSPSRGSSGSINGGGRTIPRRYNPQGFKGMLATLRVDKGGQLEGVRGSRNRLAARVCMGQEGPREQVEGGKTASIGTGDGGRR